LNGLFWLDRPEAVTRAQTTGRS